MKCNSLKISLFVALASLASCKYQKNNHKDQLDVRAGDTYVYGVHPDSAAVQSKMTYTPNPDLAERTKKIKAKLAAK